MFAALSDAFADSVAVNQLLKYKHIIFRIVDKVTPTLINVQTRSGFSEIGNVKMVLLTKNLMRSLRHY